MTGPSCSPAAAPDRFVTPAREAIGVTELPDRCQRLLRLQRGMIATWQADYAGLSVATMKNLVRPGRWHRLHLGVYAAFTGQPPRCGVMGCRAAGRAPVSSQPRDGRRDVWAEEAQQAAACHYPAHSALEADPGAGHPQVSTGPRADPRSWTASPADDG